VSSRTVCLFLERPAQYHPYRIQQIDDFENRSKIPNINTQIPNNIQIQISNLQNIAFILLMIFN